MPLSPRPLSIFSALKARQSKQNVSAASTATQPLTISAPIPVADNIGAVAMPPSNMSGSRMLTYAKGGTLPGTNVAPSAQSREQRRADTPAVGAVPLSEPTQSPRQAISIQAKVPIAKPGQYPASAPVYQRKGSQGSQGSHHAQSPPHASPPIRRTRTNSESRDGGVWEASSVGESVFNSPSLTDWEKNGTRALQSSKFWNQTPEGHVYRTRNNSQPERGSGRGSQDLAPFIIGENGMMEVVPGQPLGPSLTTINSSLQSGILSEHAASKEHFQPGAQFQSPGSGRAAPKTRLPMREAKLRKSYSEHHSGYVGEDELMSSSPTYESPRHGYQRGQKDDPLDSKRTTEFADLDEHIVDPMVDDSDFSTHSNIDFQQQALSTPKASKTKPKSKTLLESSLPLSMGKEEEKSRKRRRSGGDYKDSTLHKMRYEELRNQPFDFDPARATAQIGGVTPMETLTTQLQHYKGQAEAAQRTFFTEMSVADWESSGDWFMDQFSVVAQKLKEARKSRRAVVEQFETEIHNREQLITTRTRSIGDKLGKMREDGEHLLQDKEI
jgi:hypothetical protein